MSETAGYSGKSLALKLGLEPGMTLRLLDEPGHYWDLLGGTPASLEVRSAGGDSPADFTHLFATDRGTLAGHFLTARGAMTEDGLVWASWPKKSSGVDSDVGRSEVMAAGKAVGLVDVKVCAVDATWSGLKFVIPLAERR